MRIVVVGAGVVGLACAARLTEVGHTVQVWTEDATRSTEPAVSAAMWWPAAVTVGGADERAGAAARWSAATYDRLALLTALPDSGVRLRRGRAVFREPQADPWWAAAVPRLARCRPALLPVGYADGFAFAAPVVDMWQYLAWLIQRLATVGVPIVERELRDLAAARQAADVVVNCTGADLESPADDEDGPLAWSQVLRVANVGLTEWLRDEQGPDGPVSLVPRGDEVVCGGVVDPGAVQRPSDAGAGGRVRDAGADRRVPGGVDTERILAHCRTLLPELAGAPVLSTVVEPCPVRPSVRLDRDGDVVLCYGHSGMGLTLSWGCADEVARLVSSEPDGDE